VKATIEITGLDEFIRTLRDLPEDLTREAGIYATRTAEECANQIGASYAVGPTGNLKAGVGFSERKQTAVATAIVRSRAPHAHLYEFGATRKDRGIMPAARVFVPTIVAGRSRLFDQLVRLVERAGFEVRF
jgi:Bacteriophage HK97-gp10, putative tail-component